MSHLHHLRGTVGYYNRTYVELKCEAALRALSQLGNYNRTYVELKYRARCVTFASRPYYNRTYVELKLKIARRSHKKAPSIIIVLM